jgi:hypothetical protein
MDILALPDGIIAMERINSILFFHTSSLHLASTTHCSTAGVSNRRSLTHPRTHATDVNRSDGENCVRPKTAASWPASSSCTTHRYGSLDQCPSYTVPSRATAPSASRPMSPGRRVGPAGQHRLGRGVFSTSFGRSLSFWFCSKSPDCATHHCLSGA